MKKNNTVSHAGILGMHWGIRRNKTQATTTVRGKTVGKTTSVRGKSQPVMKTKTSLIVKKKKRLSDMSDEELKKIATRLQLEKQYKDLTKADLGPGRKFVGDVLLGAGKQVAITYVAKYMGKGVESLLKVANLSG